MKVLTTNHFLNYEFVYIFLLVCFVLFIFLLMVKKLKLKLFILVLLSLFFSLFVSEFYFLYFKRSYRIITADNVEESKFPIIIKDTKSTSVNMSIPDYCFDYDYVGPETYTNGFRYTKGNEKSEKAFVFLGCSFTFGDGVKDNETLPYYF